MHQNRPKPPQDILALFENKEIVKICAPMVRYSKLQFRNLVKSYDCDLSFTPMILADSFCKSAKARANEFTTNSFDAPLITQFAANTVHDFVGAAHLVAPYCDGVDLNCGCPQRWARQQGLGCIMLQNPEMIYDIVSQCRNQIPQPFTVSVKMRLRSEIKKTVEICRQLEKCGVSFVTVHGRTAEQLTGSINEDALKCIQENLHIPVIANGGVKSLEECRSLKKRTNCKGIMVANALLTNPTLFSGSNITTTECIQKWIDICYNCSLNEYDKCRIPTISEQPQHLTFQCFHHHLVFMLEKNLTKVEKRIFNNLQSFPSVLDFIEEKFKITPQIFSKQDFYDQCLINLDYTDRYTVYNDLKPNSECDLLYDYDSSKGVGKYFREKMEDNDDCDWSGIFSENK